MLLDGKDSQGRRLLVAGADVVQEFLDSSSRPFAKLFLEEVKKQSVKEGVGIHHAKLHGRKPRGRAVTLARRRARPHVRAGPIPPT